MKRHHVFAVVLVVALSSNAYCEKLTYDFHIATGNERTSVCDLLHEEKRREIITKHNLPLNLPWHDGTTKNEWGDIKERFCFLEHKGTYYLSFLLGRFWEKSIPDRVVSTK